MTNPNDALRDRILGYLYAVHSRARSPKSAAVGIKEPRVTPKPFSYRQRLVASDLDCLVQKRWATEVIEKGALRMGGTADLRTTEEDEQ